MKSALVRALAGLIATFMLALPLAGHAQGDAPFTRVQIERLVAPIALYPDQLLGQILTAATYPLEVVEAARWVRMPEHARLRGDDLFAALEFQDWAPSVKSLVPFPEVLETMDQHLGWTQQLGDAFLAQPIEVMNAIQRLRARALASGHLHSTPQMVVYSDGTTIVIEPRDPNHLYIPDYDPTTIYGAWPYPDYPPYDFIAYPAGGVRVSGIHFGIALVVIARLWGWDHCDWRNHRIRIDDNRYNAIDRAARARDRRPRVTANTWQHDPFHRRGVAYRDAHSRERFLGAKSGPAATRRVFRGYETTPTPSPPTPPARPRTTPPRSPTTTRQQPPAPSRTYRPAPTATQPSPRPAPATAPAPRTPRTAPPTIRPLVTRPAMTTRPQTVTLPPMTTRPAQPAARPAPPAFGEIDQGRNVRRDAERGRASRQSATPPPRQPSGAQRPAERQQQDNRERRKRDTN